MKFVVRIGNCAQSRKDGTVECGTEREALVRLRKFLRQLKKYPVLERKDDFVSVSIV